MSRKAETTATKEETTPALVPKLRFPEFRKAEGWTEKPLKAAAHINPANGGLPESFVYIDLESVDAGELKAKERISRIGAPSRAQRLVERGDIIYQVVRPYQRNNLLCEFDDDEEYVASTGYAQLRAKGSNRFLYQSIHTNSFVGRVIAKCTGSNYPAINSSDLAEIQLPIPPTLPEQQKIAECLSSVDELIAAQARKLDALKTHKKGLMQQLFPREGETQPRLRFPEFQNAGEWEECTVEEIIITVTPPKKLQTSDYQTEGEFPIVDQSQDYICGWTDDADAVIDKGLPVIIFGDHTCALKFVDRPFVQGADGIKILRSRRGIDIRFLFCALEANPVVQESYKRHFSMLKEKKMSFPVAKPGEQQRIATCLSSLDALISAETQKLEALKTHKKGLMQQLFPSPEEVEA
jgi:type I restriction enzyme S subunit